MRKILIFILLINTLILHANEPIKILDSPKASVLKLKQNFMFSDFDVAVSQPYQELIGLDKKPIKELKGIYYSYIFALAPIGSATVISFDLDKDLSEKIKIDKLTFTTPDKGMFIKKLHGFATGKQKSKKQNSDVAYSFGALNPKTLARTVEDYHKNNAWQYIQAQIRVTDLKTKQKKVYDILINTKLFNDFAKFTNLEYKNNKYIKRFPIPVK